jgi:hypothetical protein
LFPSWRGRIELDVKFVETVPPERKFVEVDRGRVIRRFGNQNMVVLVLLLLKKFDGISVPVWKEEVERKNSLVDYLVRDDANVAALC